MNNGTVTAIYVSLWGLIVLSIASIVAGIWLNDYRWVASGLVIGVSSMIALMATALL